MSSDALKPEPVTELPLTPPAEEDEEDAAIALWKTKQNVNNTHKRPRKATDRDQISPQTLLLVGLWYGHLLQLLGG